ncbi:MAG: hypothetical protein AAGM22_22290 [Acidobacteriota bacterium]
MKPLTERALITCDHATGVVAHKASQSLVRIAGAKVLVGNDPASQSIGGCINSGPTIKPCARTLAVEQGKSGLVFVKGKPMCLETVVGGTDGTPPSVTKYRVRSPGQRLVTVSD